MQEYKVRSHADESARQAHDVVRPVTYFHGVALKQHWLGAWEPWLKLHLRLPWSDLNVYGSRRQDQSRKVKSYQSK
jgi:hypothetical protein